MKRYIVSIIAIMVLFTTQAQEFSEFTKEDFEKDENYGWFNYFQLSIYRGNHLGEGKSVNFLNDGVRGIGLRFGTQSTGRKEWQRIHGYPQYGFGLTYFDLGGLKTDSIIGKPMACYIFFGAPIVRFGDLRLNIDVELGISTDFIAYNSNTNPNQIFIGASTNLHSNFNLQLYYELSERTDISLGLSFIHFSNGKIYTPNKGLNVIGLNLSTTYHFNPVKNFTKHADPNFQTHLRPTFVQKEIPTFKDIHELSIMGSFGSVQSYPKEWKHEDGMLDTTYVTGPRYLNHSFSVDYGYQFAHRLKVTVGLDMFIDNSAVNLYDDILPKDVNFSKKTFYGGHIGFQYIIERIVILYNFGRYIYKPFDSRGKWYMRVGGRIGLTPKVDVQIALKTKESGKADWIEWGIVYKMRSK